MKEEKQNTLTDAQEMAEAYCNTVKPYFEIIRNHCDKLELLVDNELWTLTKYRELCLHKIKCFQILESKPFCRGFSYLNALEIVLFDKKLNDFELY
jgi:hypothetical protein